MKFIKGGITAPKGFTASGHYCGIKKSKKKKKDLSLVYSEVLCTAAGVFTTNKVQASCVVINKKRVAGGKAQAIVVNSGNANCLTGKHGFEDSLTMARTTAGLLQIPQTHVCVASTGVIGKPLPMQKITGALPKLVKGLSKKGGKAAAQGIMTTDHVEKQAAVEFFIGGKKVRIGAMTKGGGMIHPKLALPHATMLCFVSTDASIASPALRAALDEAVQNTFNMITVDGDMSTNDMVLILANGQAKNKPIKKSSKEFKLFASALEVLFLVLAKMMIRDAEGATKFVEVAVKNAKTPEDARTVAKSVASSNLVKCAVRGSDPNWGRIAAAAGYSGAKVDPWKLKVYLGKTLVLKNGDAMKNTTAKAEKEFAKKDIAITVDVSLGKFCATAYTCDLSTEYVKFNSAYHT